MSITSPVILVMLLSYTGKEKEKQIPGRKAADM
jgi:hypothetical protein